MKASASSMRLRLLALLLALAQVDARWTAALMLANGTTLTARDSSLFRSDSAVTVYGADNIVDLAYDATTLLAVTSSCVLSVSENIASVHAGSVYESGQRDGPPLYARFSNLIALAFVSEATTVSIVESAAIVLIDTDRADGSIIIVNEQAARPLAIVPQAFVLSGFRDIVLVISPVAAKILRVKVRTVHLNTTKHNVFSDSECCRTAQSATAYLAHGQRAFCLVQIARC